MYALRSRLRPIASKFKPTVRNHGGPHVSRDAPTIPIHFINPSSKGSAEDVMTVQGRIGETILQTAHRHDIDLEGACEGVCACSTCHVVMTDDLYDKLEEPSEDEEDMLDMAFALTTTSRLGCQVILSEKMKGSEIRVPAATRNFYVDGHIPVPH
uniref:2Fe-2S ferredoxin-type domain-containing protein n=1 Tax=Chaetoceros debilis TaxID=122233 RepID=A0A7S3V716_9STRA|mmetsp:Transcript_10514/g.15917  ORF Transcript_10514/g.15917 Transcript_10514/m.15917 type:complete len:155 (+) Transcript_10514:116-580(+)|eukprot:CAMPEP_0194085488 /NCGR_PEP_ID=MMETSP0149-20130528/17602_1 /TAXON_ID=122233 /ORGANISM="Chaetoceros debilis, Strain MM31A-1" /LENGTH=154 /DNA_ID=CAMNT_0038768379 /DNA_START=73 /DNA_END=537 /DNA_ORIENTATION=-